MDNRRQFQPIEPGLTGHPILEPGEDFDRSPPDVCVVLQRARLNAGYELDDVASALRIRLAHLKALEEGRFDDLPGKTYAIGFLRSYAEFLGLDKDEVIRLFKEETEAGAQEQQPHLHFPAPSKEGGMPKPWLMLLVLALAGLGYGGWHYYSTQGDVAADLVTDVSDTFTEMTGLIDKQAGNITQSSEPTTATTETTDFAASAATGPDSTTGATADRPSVWSWGRVSEASQETPDAAPAPAPSQQDEVDASATEAMTTPAAPEPAVETETTAEAEPAVEPTELDEASVEPAPSDTADEADSAMASESADAAEPDNDVVAETETARVEEAPSDSTEEVRFSDSGTDGVSVEVLEDDFGDEGDVGASGYSGYPGAATSEASDGADVTIDEGYADADSSSAPEVAAGSNWGAPSSSDSSEFTYDSSTQTQTLERQREIASASNGSISGANYVPQVYGGANYSARVVITATEDAWVQVQGPQNELLLTRILRAGDSYRVPDRSGLKMVTGNAGALEIRVDGQLIEPIGPVGVVRRNVSLDPSSLKGGASSALD